MIGPLGSANREIREADRRDQLRRRARLAEPRRLTDDLLRQLEELNLDGAGTVPDGYEGALAVLREQLEGLAKVRPRLIEQLQPGTRTAELIDIVFIIQEIIAPPRLPSASVAVEAGRIGSSKCHSATVLEPSVTLSSSNTDAQTKSP